MCERPRDEKRPQEPASPPAESDYTAEEEAEVQRRLEDLGYVE